MASMICEVFSHLNDSTKPEEPLRLQPKGGTRFLSPMAGQALPCPILSPLDSHQAPPTLLPLPTNPRAGAGRALTAATGTATHLHRSQLCCSTGQGCPAGHGNPPERTHDSLRFLSEDKTTNTRVTVEREAAGARTALGSREPGSRRQTLPCRSSRSGELRRRTGLQDSTACPRRVPSPPALPKSRGQAEAWARRGHELCPHLQPRRLPGRPTSLKPLCRGIDRPG